MVPLMPARNAEARREIWKVWYIRYQTIGSTMLECSQGDALHITRVGIKGLASSCFDVEVRPLVGTP